MMKILRSLAWIINPKTGYQAAATCCLLCGIHVLFIVSMWSLSIVFQVNALALGVMLYAWFIPIPLGLVIVLLVLFMEKRPRYTIRLMIPAYLATIYIVGGVILRLYWRYFLPS